MPLPSVSTTEPEQWVQSQAPQAEMRALWPVLLKEAWQENHQQALDDIDSIDLPTALAWAAVKYPPFASALSNTVASVHDTEPVDDDHKEARMKAAKAAVRRLCPDPGASKFDLLDRIYSISVDRGIDFLDLLCELKASRNLMTMVQKNATKGMKYEKVAAAFMESRCAGLRVLRLSERDTKLSIRFDEAGNALPNQPARDEHSKDADLAVIRRVSETAAHVYLVSHKFARVGGGHQDNQRKDAAAFLAYAAKGASSQATEITELTALVRKVLGNDTISVCWEPALVLDGDFFIDAPTEMAAKVGDRPAFVGDTDTFVSFITQLDAPAELAPGMNSTCTRSARSLSAGHLTQSAAHRRDPVLV